MERGFIGLDIAVLAVSDAATVAEDVPARIVIEKLESAGHRITARERIDDSLQLIKAKYLEWIADSQIDVIIVTSGAKSESASEALAPLVTKPLSGFA
ncbi:MAG: molybdenum cofactor biosynthesis protein, partial [Kofleriaceae bacterium]